MDEQQLSSIAELREFTVCQLMDGLGRSYPVETTIRPVDRQFRICGSALTVECARGDNLTIHHALHIAQPGDVLIVGGSPDCGAALWGELMSISAQSKGLGGTIIDGPIRDPLEIRSLGYPVFCRDINPSRATKQTYGRINVPVRIGAISISPKDVVLADANGIISIARARAPEAVQLASEVVKKEKTIKVQILSGRTLFDIFNLGGYVVQQQTNEK
jgi:4-hydroxy-4-methyl-2-oxoglutarate aldolase